MSVTTVDMPNMIELESQFWEKDMSVAGLDEAGRGPLAGPVAAACVIMPKQPVIDGVNDSKQLSPKCRLALHDKIIDTALDYNVAFVDADYINEKGIQAATILAFQKAYLGMRLKPDIALADYIVGLSLPVDFRVFKGGDARSYSIAAASILAKTQRDALMLELDERYPEYGFARHKGYGTSLHIAALNMFGLSPMHRKQFVATALHNKEQRGFKLTNSDWGFLGERYAEKYLKERGYTLLKRNYRAQRAEIDLIMRDGDTVVFIEVKTRSSKEYGTGAHAVTSSKQGAILRCAAAYISENSLEDTRLRFDVADVEADGTDMNMSMNHITAAFTA